MEFHVSKRFSSLEWRSVAGMTDWVSVFSRTRLDTDSKQKQTGFVSTECFYESTKPHLQVNAMALASPYAF